jgi:replicative DNA helicase
MSFNSQKQKILIEHLLCNNDLYSLCSGIIKKEYFNPEFRIAVEFIQLYYDEYSAVPPVEVVNAETETSFIKHDKLTTDVFDYTSKNIEKFCREKAVYNEFVAGADLLEDDTKISGVIDKLSQAIQISLIHDLGTDVFANVAQRARDRLDREPYISTGWPAVDEQLGGGVRKSEYLMISANSGGGKSVAMSNMAYAMVKQGLNILYISLELSETMICERFEQIITGWDRDTKIQRADELAQQVECIKHDHNATIFVKYMEPDATCTNDIKAYLKQFETQNSFLPDVLIVDYLDLLNTNDKRQYSNEYQKDKVSSTQLKSIGSNPKHMMVTITASQQNRGAIDAPDVTQGHIAGGLSKVNIVDVYISIIMNDTMRQQGIAYFKFLKTRSSGGVGNRVSMIWDPQFLRFRSTNKPVISDISTERNTDYPAVAIKIDEAYMGNGLESLLEDM